MKKLFLLLSIFILVSCTYIPTGKSTKVYYRVINIDAFAKSKVLCKYRLITGDNYFFYDNGIVLVDSVGKYSINDTVSISSQKK